MTGFRVLVFLTVVFPGLSGVRQFLSANSFSVDDVTARASVRVSMDGYGCSFPRMLLISSNVVLTAAHCLYNFSVGSISVIHKSAPTVSYWAKAMYFPESYQHGADAYAKRNGRSISAFCNVAACNMKSACLFLAYVHQAGHNIKDYGLILLKEHISICEESNPVSPVVATMGHPDIPNGNGVFVPQNKRSECFVAGYGTTDKQRGGTINMAIVSRLDGVHVTECPTKLTKYRGVLARFYNSSADNRYETSICKGDSGSGVQCISNGGKSIRVVAVATEVWHREAPAPEDSIQNCRQPHDSFVLPMVHTTVNELNNVILKWKEMENLKQAQMKCESFLAQQPYNSVLLQYLNKPPSFSG